MLFTFQKSLKMAEKGWGLTDKEITTNILKVPNLSFFQRQIEDLSNIKDGAYSESR